jgi:hypothetical protein
MSNSNSTYTAHVVDAIVRLSGGEIASYDETAGFASDLLDTTDSLRMAARMYDTNGLSQAEFDDEVRIAVATAGECNIVEIVGHDGLDDTERVIVESKRFGIGSHEDPYDLAQYLSSGYDSGAVTYCADVGGWTLVRDAETKKVLAHFIDGRPATADDYERGWLRNVPQPAR